MAQLRAFTDGIVLTHFIVSDDIDRSRRFYTEVLGAEEVISGEPTHLALANGWIIVNVGGSPTYDTPAVTLEAPHDLDRVSSFLNIRVADIQSVYAEWSARGAEFLTPPKQHETEIRCYLRDPDGHLIEVGQTTSAERLASALFPPADRQRVDHLEDQEMTNRNTQTATSVLEILAVPIIQAPTAGGPSTPALAVAVGSGSSPPDNSPPSACNRISPAPASRQTASGSTSLSRLPRDKTLEAGEGVGRELSLAAGPG
jgi:catechol 2,3-dioxygenase-like lactoylglutathione lyase family enzyme